MSSDSAQILEELFLALYINCFGSDIAHLSDGLVVLSEAGKGPSEKFTFLLFVDEQAEDFKDIGMCFLSDGAIELSWQDADGETYTGTSSRVYLLVRHNIEKWYQKIVRMLPGEPEESIARLHRARCIAMAAHEIRHELQRHNVVSREHFQTTFLDTVTDIEYMPGKYLPRHYVLKQYRRSLKLYYKNRNNIAREIDALATELRAMCAWVKSSHLSILSQRLDYVRDAVFHVG